ncbi:MAG: 4-hydroxythreonine-4-phosphate dehydrogenase PdxA [Myxococcales bacterium]|nr:4-hydroxythreonine-4-phosphate dehydrogenase PdxA [Myxococcales bacterium]
MSARIGITLGDPAGIGPEVVAAALAADAELAGACRIYGSAAVLRAAAIAMGVGLPAGLEVHDVPCGPVVAGKPDDVSGAAQVAWLEAAVAAALRGEVGALATAPISKTWAARAGLAFAGHTEYLAQRFGTPQVAMAFFGKRMKVALATIHVALAEVPRALTADKIVAVASLLHAALRDDFAIASPRLGIVGLNPHAGEGGALGHEEQTVIAPAMARLAAAGMIASGPLVPDVAFRQHLDGAFDGLVAMYHDQALIPIKLIEFDDAVNTTLGLPIVRTSPDHGTAYDIAGTGHARAGSMLAAITLARRLLAVRTAPHDLKG